MDAQMVEVYIGEYADGKEARCSECNELLMVNEYFNEYCPKCTEIESYCQYAFKEGFIDEPMTWDEKVSYYKNGMAYEATVDECEDWGDRESDLQAEIGGGN